MTRHSPLQQFKQVLQIAADHGLLVVEKTGEFLIYRRLATRNEFIAKRGTATGLRTLVCRLANFH